MKCIGVNASVVRTDFLVTVVNSSSALGHSVVCLSFRQSKMVSLWISVIVLSIYIDTSCVSSHL